MISNVQKYFWVDPDASYCKDGKRYWQSVHGKSDVRYEKAQKESKKNVVPIETIITYVNELLKAVGIPSVDNPIMKPSEVDYQSLKKKFELDDERDIIWIKFTKGGFIGVVATSNDINFNIPPCNSAYDEKVWKYNEYLKKDECVWKYNSSGILLHKLGMEWDESFILVFPLKKLKENCKYKKLKENRICTRHAIEMAIGNYLIEQNVPIIDYYSHYIG